MRRRPGAASVTIAIFTTVLSLLWTSVPGVQAALVAGRYNSGFDSIYMNPMGDRGQSSGILLPPIAWLFQDHKATYAACPVLVGVCAAVVGGYVLQHCLGRCLPVQRLAVFYPPTLKAGELWRLFSHVLLHSDLGHLLANLLHILNTLDLEGTVRGQDYPASYALGSRHTAGAAAIATVFGALVGSVSCFGAMFEGASALCFGLDGALLASCALLLGGSEDPALQGFLQVRGWYAAIHMGMDMLRACGSQQGTIGNLAHLAGFIGGFCYVILAMPPLGGRRVPIVGCYGKGWALGTSGYQECFAFFSPRYVAPVKEVQQIAMMTLAIGVTAALLNAFVWHSTVHASADGYSVLVKPPGKGPDGRGGRVLGRGDGDLEAALVRSQRTFADEQRRHRGNV